MLVALGKSRSKNFRIDSKATAKPAVIDISKATPGPDAMSGVNLRYFQKNHECFSEWVKDELKLFSGWVSKMAERTEAQITSNTQTCHAHVGKTKVVPDSISQDIKLYELDVGSKSRVHGFFQSGQFYLLWLDRNHKILKP